MSQDMSWAYQEVFFIYGFFYIRNIFSYYLRGRSGRANIFFIYGGVAGPRPTFSCPRPTFVIYFCKAKGMIARFFIYGWPKTQPKQLLCKAKFFFIYGGIMQTANSTIHRKNFGQKALQKNWAKVYLIYFCGTSEQSSGPQNPFAKILLLSIKLL